MTLCMGVFHLGQTGRLPTSLTAQGAHIHNKSSSWTGQHCKIHHQFVLDILACPVLSLSSLLPSAGQSVQGCNAHSAPVVQPVAGAARPNQALQLVGLHPDQLVHALVAPDLQALAAQLHRAAYSGGNKSHTT